MEKGKMQFSLHRGVHSVDAKELSRANPRFQVGQTVLTKKKQAKAAGGSKAKRKKR
jgi:hypothetical protein